VRYGTAVPYRSVTSLVFEQEGVGGQKQVAFNNGHVEEVSDAEYQHLWAEKSAAPAPASTPPSENAPGNSAIQPAAK
jgi:hypothetical protein